MGKLFKLGNYHVSKTIIDNNGKFRNPGKEFISVLKAGKNPNIGKFTRGVLVGMGTAVNLLKTPGFGVAMALTALTAGGIGYLLGNDNDDKDANMGLVVEKEEKDEEKDYREEILEAATPVAKVKKEEVENYHQINTAGTTWAGIIETYYPDLVEKCNGQLYGKNGAIRALKNAIKECSGTDLINETDIPKILNLPLNIDGVDVKKDGKTKKENIAEKGGHTDITEAGCKNQKTYYTVTDEDKKQSFKHEDVDIAVDSLKARTGVEEYKLDYAS